MVFLLMVGLHTEGRYSSNMYGRKSPHADEILGSVVGEEVSVQGLIMHLSDQP